MSSITPNFYRAANLIKKYLQGKVLHYPIKDPIYAVQFYEHTLKKGETIYSLAEGIFGQNTNMWTVIAEINPARKIEDWQPGDIINLPVIVTQEQYTDYRSAPIYYEAPSQWPQRKQKFELTPAPSCAVPSPIATNVSVDLIRFTWNDVPFAAYYIYQVKTSAQDWTDVPETQILTNSLDFIPVGPGVEYNFRIKTVCTFDSESAYTSQVDITSLVPGVCTIPTDLVVYFVTSETASLQWSGDGDALYEITYVEGVNTYKVSVTGISFVLKGLNPNTEYTVSVKKICVDTLSGASNEVTFTTSNSCGLPLNVVVKEYGNDFITVDWDAGINATGYELIAFEQGTASPKTLSIQNAGTSTGTIATLQQNSNTVATGLSAGKYYNGYNTGSTVRADFDAAVNGTVKVYKDGVEEVFALSSDTFFDSGVLDPDQEVLIAFEIDLVV